MNQNPPTATTTSAHARFAASLPLSDTADFADADRGFLGALEPGVVKAADGRVVWDNDSYAFLAGDAPTSVNPSLWRQSALVARQGLFEVVEGIYQVRGLDLSNITFVEGDTGVIVIDPLISTETAAAALGALPRAPRRPAGGRRHLHAQPRRPLRRRLRGRDAGRRRRRERPGHRAGGLRRARGRGERLRRHGDGRRAGYMYGAALARGPAGPGRRRARPDDVDRRGRPDRARPCDITDDRRRPTPSTGWRSSSRWHRAPRRPPRCTSTSRSTGRCAWPRTPPTPCTTCSPCAARWCATRTSGRPT